MQPSTVVTPPAAAVPAPAPAGLHVENDANRANYDEIDGHLRIIKAKLVKTSGEAPQARLVEDLEDYYERAVQMRMYRISTLEEQLKDTDARARIAGATVRALTFRMAALIFCGTMAALGCIAEIKEPGMHGRLLGQLPLLQMATHAFVAIVAAAACYVAVRSVSSAGRPPQTHAKTQ